MKNIIKLVSFSLQTILIFLLVGAVSTAVTKNIYASVLINEFKAKGVYIPEKSTNNVKIYEVESDEEIPPYTTSETKILPGNSGDILISLSSEITIPVVHEIISFFAGGHAALVLDDYADNEIDANDRFIIETTGLVSGQNTSIIGSKDYWSNSSLYKEMIGLRVKMTSTQRKKVISKAISMYKDPYNYAFIVDTKNKSYCSDLVSKAYSSIGINLNKDGFTTSVYDLLVSKETYISYYQYFDKNKVKHIYYLV